MFKLLRRLVVSYERRTEAIERFSQAAEAYVERKVPPIPEAVEVPAPDPRIQRTLAWANGADLEDVEREEILWAAEALTAGGTGELPLARSIEMLRGYGVPDSCWRVSA